MDHLPPPPGRLARLPAVELAGGHVVHRAEGHRARGLGLMGLAALGPGRALLLPSTRSVHTVGMRFALDLVWLDAAGVVVRIDRDVAPGRLRSCRRARAVLECVAGHGQALATSWRDRDDAAGVASGTSTRLYSPTLHELHDSKRRA